jgi:predicted FMN-binding regulatory protein PaiB
MTRTLCTLLVIWLAGTCQIGCDTISQDISFFTESLMPPTPREAADMMVDPHNPDNRRRGLVLIANSIFGGVDEYVNWYRLTVENPEEDPTVKSVAVRALARHGQPSDAPLIATQLGHSSEHVRWEAAKGLQRIHNPDVVSSLLTVVRNQEEQPRIRVAATHALGQYPQDRVFQALIAALDSRHLSINLAAEQSLTTLTGQQLGMDARDWSRWYGDTSVAARFANQQDFLYPTYMRDESWIEKLAFWTSRTFEHPGVPTGLAPASQRRTYDNDDAIPSSE